MAKQQRSKLTTGALPRRMQFAGGSAGAIDETTTSRPPTSLAAWFSDEAAVAKFAMPVKPQEARR